MTSLEEKAADANRTEWIKAGLPWDAYDSFKEAAQRSYTARVLEMDLDEFERDVLPTAPGWVKHNVGDSQSRERSQSIIRRLLPGQRICFDARQLLGAYRKVESVQDALFGPQISPLDYFKELNPGFDITINTETNVITLERPDRIGVTKRGVVYGSRFEERPDMFGSISDDENQYVQQVFMSGGPLNDMECHLLSRLKQVLPEREIKVRDRGSIIAAKGLEERGLLAIDDSPNEHCLRLSLTDIGLEFVQS